LVIPVVTAVAYPSTSVVIVAIIIVSVTSSIVAENNPTDAALIAASIAALCVRGPGKNQHAEEQKKEPDFVHVVTSDTDWSARAIWIFVPSPNAILHEERR